MSTAVVADIPSGPILGVDVAGIRSAIKTGYELLSEMIHVRNYRRSHQSNFSPFTPRTMFIINTLNAIGMQYELDIFDDAGYDLFDYDNEKLVNIIVKFGSKSGQPAIVFSAHHDIVKSDSQNCQDNSASVCNLLHLCAKLKEYTYGENNTLLEQRPVIIVFTDKEECGGVGARRMSGRLLRGDLGKFEYIINLELTGLGKSLWIDRFNFQEPSDEKTPVMLKFDSEIGVENYSDVKTPFSDATIFRRCGIDAICIGILPEEQIKNIKKEKPETWNLCHDANDTIDKCNATDMESFVSILEKLAIEN